MTIAKGSPYASAPTLDDLMTVSEMSPDTLRLMAARIEASRTPGHIVYRETELDEVWRLAEMALSQARHRGQKDRAKYVGALAELVHAAHDLIGEKEDPVAAAAALRKAALIAASISQIQD
jgi:hypothetical protein